MKNYLIMAAATMALQACQSNQSEEGLHAEIGAVNQKSRDGTAAVGEGTTQQFVRMPDGKRFQLETGLLNLRPVELTGCGIARMAREVLASVVPAARAHGADEHAPGGILDVSVADDSYIDLGELPVTPGYYCGLRMALEPVTAVPAEGQVDMRGSGVYSTQCYYYRGPSDTSAHYCFNFKLADSAESTVLPLDEPLLFDGSARHAALQVVVNYDRWLDRRSADDAFSALDGYAAVVENPPCDAADTASHDPNQCASRKAAFKASLQGNHALKTLFLQNILGSLAVQVAE